MLGGVAEFIDEPPGCFSGSRHGVVPGGSLAVPLPEEISRKTGRGFSGNGLARTASPDALARWHRICLVPCRETFGAKGQHGRLKATLRHAGRSASPCCATSFPSLCVLAGRVAEKRFGVASGGEPQTPCR